MTQISKNTKKRMIFEENDQMLIVDVELGRGGIPHIWFSRKWSNSADSWSVRLYARHIRKLIAWLQAVLEELEN